MSRRPDPAASRRAILKAARIRFSTTGYAGTSMHDIAQAASVTQSLIHHHFGPKDALWAEVRRFAFSEYIDQQRRLFESGQHEPALLRASIEAYFRVLADNPDILRLVAWLELDRPFEFVDEIRQLHVRGIAAIEAGQHAGTLRQDVPARFILTAFMGLVRNWFEERNLVEDESDAERVAQIDAAYLESMWTAFAEGMLAEPARRSRPGDAPGARPAGTEPA